MERAKREEPGAEGKAHLGHLLRISNDGNADGSSLGHTAEVSNQRRELSPNVGFNNLLAAPRADTGRNRLNYDEPTDALADAWATAPEGLVDSFLYHPLAADMAFTVIPHKVDIQRGQRGLPS